ncbi:Pre-mRNA-splicing factor cwc26 [Umbelopsis sp. WA50703]
MDEAKAAAAKAEYIRRKYLATAPGDASTKEYIANRYLSDGNDSKKKKKKKISKRIQKGNIGIVDEEEDSWRNSKVEDEETLEPIEEPTVTETKSLYTPKASSWTTIREGETVQGMDVDEEDEDERPMIVGDVPSMEPPRASSFSSRQRRSPSPSPPSKRPSRTTSIDKEAEDDQELRMSSGHRVGLQTADEIRAESIRLRRERDREMRELDPTLSGRDAETVHRDKGGRKIDMVLMKAEEARRKKEEMEKQEKMMEWGKGLVQREEKEAEQKRLLEERNKPLARYADDRELNDELKEQQLWNDPAAQFLSANKRKKKTKRPTYQGQWPPNRFMIPPGYRWDGVDRSNGFEKDHFLRQNARSARDAEAHAWSVEDM